MSLARSPGLISPGRRSSIDFIQFVGHLLGETLMPAMTINVNGKDRTVDVSPDMPLLWVLRDTLELTGTKFGCGMGLCGACTVHVDGALTRSCTLPVSQAAGK